MAWYAQFLSYRFKSYNSIVNYLSAVKTLHKLLNLSTEGFTGITFKLVMKGLKRLNTYMTRQAFPMTPALLVKIKASLNLNEASDATFWAGCLVAFFLLLRKSNLFPSTLKTFDAKKQLCRQDFQWLKDKVIVTLRWSKTNQFGRHERFSLPRIPNSAICPYQALQNMWELLPGETGICFKRPDSNPFTYYQFQTKLKKAVEVAGKDPSMFSSHSFRRGGTTFAFLCGVPAELIKLLGGWSSDCYLRYIQFPMEAKIAATELVKARIQHMAW